MKVNSSALYLFIYLFSLSKWNLVESAETGDANLPLMSDAAPEAAPEAILADPNADLVAQLNDLKAANDLMDQIVELKAENEKLKAELAAGARVAGVAGARGGVARGGVARGAVARRGVVGRGSVATRAPECGIGYISSSGKVISTVAHNATAYVVDGKQHTMAFNQGTAQSNNTFNATQKRNSDLILTGTRPRVTIPAAENAAAESLNAHAAEANAAAAKKEGAAARRSGAAQGRKRRDPNEVGIVNIESDDKVIATVASDSTVYTVDGDKHTLSLNQDTSLSDNTFEKGSFPLGDAGAAGAAAHVAAAPKNLREVAAELDGELLTVVDEGGESVFTESPVFPA